MTQRLLSKYELEKDKLPSLKQWQQLVQNLEQNQAAMERDQLLKQQLLSQSSPSMDTGELAEHLQQATVEQLAVQNSALQSAANGIAIADTNGDVLWVNDAFTRLTQYTLDELLGKNLRILKSGLQEDAYYKHLWETIASGQVWQGEIINKRKDGTFYTEEMTITPVRALGKEITHYIAIKQDISERKQKEAQIEKNQQSQEILTSLLQLSLEDATLEDLLQRALDLILSTPWLPIKAQGSIFLVEEDDVLTLKVHHKLAKPLLKKCANVPFGRCLCGQAAASGETLFTNCIDERHETRFKGMAPHGHYNVPIWLDAQVIGVINLYVAHGHQRDAQEIAFLDAAAKTLAILIKRKRAEEALVEQRSFLRQVIDINPSLIFAKDRDGRFTLANQALANIYGVAVEELIGKKDSDFVKNPDRAEQFLLEDREIMDSLQEKQAPMDITVDLEGKPRRFLTTKRPLVGSDGVANQVLGVVTDVTQLVQIEDELRKSEVRTRLIIETALDAVVSMDAQGIITGWNRRAEKIFGWSQKEALGRLLAETIMPEQQRETYQLGIQRFLTTGEKKLVNRLVEITAVHRNGSEFPVELSISPIKNENGYTFNAFIRDITERKQAEEQITYQAKSLTTINDVAKALYNSLDVKSIAEKSVEAVQTFTKAPVVTFYELIGEDISQYLSLLVSRGLSAKTKKASKKLPVQGSLSGVTIAQKTFIRSKDLQTDDRIEPEVAKALQKQGLKNVFSIPLLAQDRAVGVINFLYKESQTLTEQEEETLLAIGNTIGLALTNAQYVKQVEMEIVERKKLERQIQASLALRGRQVTLSTQIAQEIAAAPNLHDLYQRVVSQVQEQFGYYHTQLLRYDVSMDILGLVVGYGDVGQKMLEMNHSMPLGVGLIGTAASTKKPVLRPDVRQELNWQSNPLLPDTCSELAVPIKLREEVLGVLDVQSDKVNGITANDQLLLEGLCGQIAIAIESTELRQDMEGRLRELSLLQRQMSREGWQKYRQRRQAHRGYQFDLAGLQQITNQPPAQPPSENGRNGTASQTQPKRQVMKPLKVRGEEIGCFGVEDDPERPLTDEEQEIINAIAEELSEALEAARLFEQTQMALAEQERLASELETVAQVSTAASTILEVDELLQTVVNLAKSSFSLYHAHIYLANEAGSKLRLKAGAGNVGHLMSLEGRDIDLDEVSIVARAARTGKGVLENNVRRTVDFLPHPLLPETRAEMALPMLVGGKLIGVLDLQADKENFFTEEDLNVQTTLAAQIAIAVENANQYAAQVKAATKLREVDQLKSEFLASMSHELRTPLNSIIGFADVLLEGLDGDLNDRMEEDVRLIRSSGDHLRGLIGDILDMSKIEAGRMDLRYESINLADLAKDVVATTASLAQEKQLFLHLDIDEGLKPVQADRTRLRQILWNIIGNAIKFTEKGSVTISLQAQPNYVLCSVRDTGIGIKEDQRMTVFEQFRQIDGGLNRAAGGTGLGMPITRKLVELHGGEIWIESVYGQGSTFLFTIPYVPPKKKFKTVDAVAETS